MHISSYQKMTRFREQHLSRLEGQPLSIVDIGSQDVNGCYKPLFDHPSWRYLGADLSPGKNVDIVLSDPHNWRELATASFDVVVTGQVFEHVEYVWCAILELQRILKPGGICCIIAPAGGFEHRYPVDCWRFYPDGFKALAKYANLDVIECYTEWEGNTYADGSEIWKDSVLISRKPLKISLKQRLRQSLRRYVLRIM